MSIHAELSDAIEHGDLQAATKLLDRHPELIDHPDWRPPPLHCAVLWDQPEIAELLIDRGANLELLDPDRGTTPLRYAIMFAKPRMIQLLVEKGANRGPIVAGGTSALQLARNASNGAFGEFDDLPSADAYLEIVVLLEGLETS